MTLEIQGMTLEKHGITLENQGKVYLDIFVKISLTVNGPH